MRIKAFSAVALVINTEFDILLCRGPRLWSIPGGKLEPGESSRKAVFREFIEETGQVPSNGSFTARDFEYLFQHKTHKGDPMDVYLFPVDSGANAWVCSEGAACFFTQEQARLIYRPDWRNPFLEILEIAKERLHAPQGALRE